MKKYHIGYTQGVFDMFHIGHLNLLRHAKEHCDYLVVGVNSDALVKTYKNIETVVQQQERAEIVNSIQYVDYCVIVNSLDKREQWEKHKFDVVFIGDDWKGNERWNKTENELKKIGVDVIYLSYTAGISSTYLRNRNTDIINKQ